MNNINFLLFVSILCIVCLCGCATDETWYYSNPCLEVSIDDHGLISFKTISDDYCRKDIYLPPINVNWKNHFSTINANESIAAWQKYLDVNSTAKNNDGVHWDFIWTNGVLERNFSFTKDNLMSFPLDYSAFYKNLLQMSFIDNDLPYCFGHENRLGPEFNTFYLQSIDFTAERVKKYCYSFVPKLNVDIRNKVFYSLSITLEDERQNCFFCPLYFEYNNMILALNKDTCKMDLLHFLAQNDYLIIENAKSNFDELRTANGEREIAIIATVSDPLKGSFLVLFVGDKIFSFKYYAPVSIDKNVKIGTDRTQMYQFPIDKKTIMELFGDNPMVFTME